MTFDADDPRHQDFETQWWSDCANTFSEENKQLIYANLMGLLQVNLGEKWPIFDLGRRNVLDVGGGPVSILLKCVNAGQNCVVLDPGDYPAWTVDRYEYCGIRVVRERAEDWLEAVAAGSFDEAWCYNVLQHVVDPERIVVGMRQAAATVRIFEWIDTPPVLGHPHTLTAATLDEWLDGPGHVTQLNHNGCHGLSYSGVFKKG
ncbi:MAG TPA: methyltransferase domain-containing protein [Jiangellaceae bacterium]